MVVRCYYFGFWAGELESELPNPHPQPQGTTSQVSSLYHPCMLRSIIRSTLARASRVVSNAQENDLILIPIKISRVGVG